MLPRSHLLLTRWQPTVTNDEAGPFVPVLRCCLKVEITTSSVFQLKPTYFVDYQKSGREWYYYRLVPVSQQSWLVYWHFPGLFNQRLPACPHVRIYV